MKQYFNCDDDFHSVLIFNISFSSEGQTYILFWVKMNSPG